MPQVRRAAVKSILIGRNQDTAEDAEQPSGLWH